MKNSLILLLLLNCVGVMAQAPMISNIAPLNAAPVQNLVITGSGFSSTKTNLNVWFDHVKGTIIKSSAFSIEVQVPPQARFSNIEVLNLSNNLSGKSQLKFLPSFGGASFDATKITTPFTSADPTELFDIASCDLDLDGKPDLAVTKTNNGTPATDIIVYQNQSSAIGTIAFGKFDQTTLPALNVSSTTANIACGDLNGDGKPEIVATRVGATRNEVFILRNTNTVAGTLSFAAVQKVLLDVGQFAFRVFIRDLNRDGKPELVVSNSFDDLNPATDSQFYIFPNQSTGGTISFGTPIKLSVTGASTTYGLDVQDLDGDGLPDIVLNQFQTSDLFIFRNQSTGTISFAPSQRITAPGTFNNVTSSDLNKDGLLDLVVTATLDNALQIFVNNSTPGNISFQSPQVLTTSLGPWGVDVSDIDGDGDADVIVANRNEAKVNVFRQDATLSFTRLDIATAKPTRNLRVGDYDGDGKPDIAVTSFSSTFSVDVIRNANCFTPLITNSTPGNICTGQTIRLRAIPALGASFAWQNGGSTFTTTVGTIDSTDVTTPGSYTIVATSEGGGCVVTSPPVILNSSTGSAPANPTISNNTPCLGSSLNLSTPTVTSATYAWTGPNGFTSSSQNPTITPVVADDAGVYSLQVTVGACSSNVVTKLLDVASVPTLPVNASPASTICGSTGNVVTLSVSGASYTYQWNNNGSAISGQTSTSLVASTEGNYSVVVTDPSTTCSQETAKTPVVMLTVPFAAFSFTGAPCTGSVITFTDNSTKDSRGTISYAWNFDGTATSTSQNPTFTYTTAASFNPSLTISYSGITGCTSSVANPITINTPVVPTIVAGANPICPGQATTLSITGNFSTISWSGDNSLTGSTASVPINQPGNYAVNTTDGNGCPSSGSIQVTAAPPISPFSVSTDKTNIKLGDKAQLTATAGEDTYAWTPAATLDNPAIATPTAKPTVTTTYTVTATKSGFCNAVDSVKITVDTGGGANINAPVLFSPNGDSFNDSWKIPDTDSYPDCTMTIYDGHGSQVYQQKGYNSNNYWDGTYNGKNVPDGTYFYVFSCPTLKATTGSVLVVR
jgi:gliding motility-associated-like protein